MEIAAINANSDFFNRHPYLDIEIHNETIYNKVQNTTAKRINFVRKQCARVANATEITLQQGFFPLILLEITLQLWGALQGLNVLMAPNK